MKKTSLILLGLMALFLISCNGNTPTDEDKVLESDKNEEDLLIMEKVNEYAVVELKSDLSDLSENQRKMLPLLIEAAQLMDVLFWEQTFPERDTLLSAIEDKSTLQFFGINYGPWDRLDNDRPFIKGIGEKPKGAGFYPAEMTTEELEKADLKNKDGLYNFIRRGENGELITVPFHDHFKVQLEKAADLLRKAADLAEDKGFKNYLELRAEALLTDDFKASDLAWMDMKDNTIDLIIGPIETYEDQLFGYKASYEGVLLHKDKEWSERLAKYAAILPELQAQLPVSDLIKHEKPGTGSDLNAYDVLYYAGAANAGGKSIAVNLPNDEAVQLEKGTRRLQLKNVMKAKFDKIMMPIAEVLIVPEQQKYVTYDAFFANTMFHEVAHGLGIKNTITGKGTVRKALKDHASAFEEGKADILGLFMVEYLFNQGQLEGQIEDYYTTFLAGIFRSVRFGTGDAHGMANMMRFTFFEQKNAFTRLDNGTYRVNFEEMKQAVTELSTLILLIQAEGSYPKANNLITKASVMPSQLQADLDVLKLRNIPKDVIFNQGLKVLGLD